MSPSEHDLADSSTTLPRLLDAPVPDDWRIEETIKLRPADGRGEGVVELNSVPVDGAVDTAEYPERGKLLGYTSRLGTAEEQDSSGRLIRSRNHLAVVNNRRYAAAVSAFADSVAHTPERMENALTGLTLVNVVGASVLRRRIGRPNPDDEWLVEEGLTATGAGFSLVLSSKPVESRLDAERFALVEKESVAAFREHRFREHCVFGGRPGYVRLFTSTHDSGGPVAMAQCFYAFGGRGYLGTAATLTSDWEAVEGRLLELLESAHFASVEASKPSMKERLFRVLGRSP